MFMSVFKKLGSKCETWKEYLSFYVKIVSDLEPQKNMKVI